MNTLALAPQRLLGGLVIRNARIVLPETILPDASLVIEEGLIRDVTLHPGPCAGFRTLDASGKLLLPGFIDIHSDVIENAIQPRPGGRFPVDVAMHELDKQLIACGVTTIFHCLCFVSSDENPPFRNGETTDFLIRQIGSLRDGFNGRSYVHARYEVTNFEAFEQVAGLISRKLIHLFSIMDHTPGQGQYTDVSHFKAYYGSVRGLSDGHLDAMIERRQEARQRVDWKGIVALVNLCRERGICVASHDDDSAAKVELVRRLGVTLCEFPVNLEAARAARANGMLISLGSPNVLRGASLTGNLSGVEALAAGLGDILCSDYAPMSLLHSVMKLGREGVMDLTRAVRLITLNAAEASGIAGWTGSIEPGKAADLVLVDDRKPVPRILRTFVGGREVFRQGE